MWWWHAAEPIRLGSLGGRVVAQEDVGAVTLEQACNRQAGPRAAHDGDASALDRGRPDRDGHRDCRRGGHVVQPEGGHVPGGQGQGQS